MFDMKELKQMALKKVTCGVGSIPDTWEEAIRHSRAPVLAYWYARDVIQGRWPEGEPTIASTPMWAYMYAKNVIGGRWPEAEEAISQDPTVACLYTDYVVNR